MHVPPLPGRLHCSNGPVQAVLQQTPSTQNPVEHSEGVTHSPPCGMPVLVGVAVAVAVLVAVAVAVAVAVLVAVAVAVAVGVVLVSEKDSDVKRVGAPPQFRRTPPYPSRSDESRRGLD